MAPALPADLSLATRNMLTASGSARPLWELTDINSIMSNTIDKVTEDASGGKMIAGRPPGGQLGSNILGGMRSPSNSPAAGPG